MPNDKDTLEEIRQKVALLLNDDSLGAVGKRFDHDHHVHIKTKLLELLEEDIPNLLQQNEQQKAEIERMTAERDIYKDQDRWFEAYSRVYDDRQCEIGRHATTMMELQQSREENERLRGLLDRIGNICIDHENAKYEPVGTVRLIQRIAAYPEKGEYPE